MKRVHEEASWPESWRSVYNYDLQEVYGEITNLGYAYAYANRLAETLKLVKEVLPIGSCILDIAAAQGNFSLLLAEAGYRVTWNDLREELAAYVALKHEWGEITYAPGNVFDLGYRDEFDLVLITEIIEHVAHPDQFLLKVSAMIKPNGYIVMSTPNGAYFRNRLPKFSECKDPTVYESVQFKPNSDGHIFLLHPKEICDLAKASNLCIDELRLFTTPLTNGHMKLELLLRLLPRKFVCYVERISRFLPKMLAKRVLIQIGARLVRASHTE